MDLVSYDFIWSQYIHSCFLFFPPLQIFYLNYQGIPEHAEVQPVARTPGNGQAANSPTQMPQPTQPAPVTSSGPNANPLDLFPQVFSMWLFFSYYFWVFFGWVTQVILKQGLPDVGSGAAGAGSLDFLRNSPQVSLSLSNPVCVPTSVQAYLHLSVYVQMTDSYLSKLVWTVVFSNSIAVSSFASYGAGKSSIIAGSFSSIWYMFLQRNILLTIIILQPMLQELGKQNPQLVRLIQEHQADFLRLINEPVQGGEG